MNGRLRILRAAPAHVQIERYLSNQIQTGVLSAGTRLPSTIELARNWGVHHTAVQKAMARLTAAGLIERTPRRGTFVSSAADSAVIGVLFGPSLGDQTAYFYRAILRAMRNEMGHRRWTCRAYDSLVEMKTAEDINGLAAIKHLREDLRNYSFKGLIEFDVDSSRLNRIDEQGSLPRAVWRFGDVDIDWYHFAYESVEFLAKQGRKQIVFLRTGQSEPGAARDFDGYSDAVQKFGIQGHRVEQLDVEGGGQSLEREAHQKMVQMIETCRRTGAWPDGLLVSDDVAMRGIALALLQCGVEVPRRLMIVCGANEGVVHHYGVPVTRYEFSPKEIVKNLLEVLWRRMVGQSLPPLPVMVRGRLKTNELE